MPTVLVTGASRGIGKTIATQLLGQFDRTGMAGTGQPGSGKLDLFACELDQLGSRCQVVQRRAGDLGLVAFAPC